MVMGKAAPSLDVVSGVDAEASVAWSAACSVLGEGVGATQAVRVKRRVVRMDTMVLCLIQCCFSVYSVKVLFWRTICSMPTESFWIDRN
jgi:hypothetical protein